LRIATTGGTSAVAHPHTNNIAVKIFFIVRVPSR
jgi:hypothetical protein